LTLLRGSHAALDVDLQRELEEMSRYETRRRRVG
jgi:hypothetical protein